MLLLTTSKSVRLVTAQFADKPIRVAVSQTTDWSTRGLVNSLKYLI